MSKRKSEVPIIQWITAGAGALVVIATLTILARAAIAHDVRPPEIHISHDAPVRAPSGYLVTIHARNDGDETAADVLIAGEIAAGPASPSTSAEVTLDFLPPQATRHASLLFSQDPTGRPLTIRAVSYTTP